MEKHQTEDKLGSRKLDKPMEQSEKKNTWLQSASLGPHLGLRGPSPQVTWPLAYPDIC